jgi:hypothetical protein
MPGLKFWRTAQQAVISSNFRRFEIELLRALV